MNQKIYYNRNNLKLHYHIIKIREVRSSFRKKGMIRFCVSSILNQFYDDQLFKVHNSKEDAYWIRIRQVYIV